MHALTVLAPVVHDDFDWWASIWIPTIVGGATLLAAMASLVVALQARRLSTQALRVETDRRQQERAQTRIVAQKALDRLWKRQLRHTLGEVPDDGSYARSIGEAINALRALGPDTRTQFKVMNDLDEIAKGVTPSTRDRVRLAGRLRISQFVSSDT